MNFMTMNLSERLISVSKGNNQELERALRDGWSRADFAWEALMVNAIENWLAGERFEAKLLLWRARWLAWRNFSKQDIRKTSIYANMAIIADQEDRHLRTKVFKEKALNQWVYAPDAIENMTIATRSRSSLFHLRMEARHRETYHANMKHRFMKFAAEMEDTLKHIGEKSTFPHRHFSRWKGERPNVYDDTRKILSASLLVIDVKESKL